MRIKVFLIIIGLIWVSHSSTADPIKRGIKALRKGNFERAKENFKKAYQKDAKSSVTNYYMAQYFYFTKIDFNCDSAYFYVVRSENLSGAQLLHLLDYKLISDSILYFKKEIEDYAFNDAMISKSISNLEHYISNYKDNSNLKIAIKSRNEIAYNIAIESNKKGLFQDFVEKYPTATQIPLAKEKIAEFEFSETTESKSLAEYKKFRDKHKGDSWEQKALKGIYTLEFDSCMEAKNSESFKQYIHRYPESDLKIEAKIKYDYYLFEEVKVKNNIDDFKKFIIENPESKYINRAHNYIYDLFTLNQTDTTKLGEFVKKFPDNPFKNQAEELYYNLFTYNQASLSRLAIYSFENPKSRFKLEADKIIYNLATDSQRSINKLAEFAIHYPQSPFAVKAEKRYYDLYTENQTSINKVESFIGLNKESSFLKDAGKRLFELHVVNCNKQNILNYINKYPNSKYVVKVWKKLYECKSETDEIITSRIKIFLKNKAADYKYIDELSLLAIDKIDYTPIDPDSGEVYALKLNKSQEDLASTTHTGDNKINDSPTIKKQPKENSELIVIKEEERKSEKIALTPENSNIEKPREPEKRENDTAYVKQNDNEQSTPTAIADNNLTSKKQDKTYEDDPSPFVSKPTSQNTKNTVDSLKQNEIAKPILEEIKVAAVSNSKQQSPKMTRSASDLTEKQVRKSLTYALFERDNDSYTSYIRDGFTENAGYVNSQFDYVDIGIDNSIISMEEMVESRKLHNSDDVKRQFLIDTKIPNKIIDALFNDGNDAWTMEKLIEKAKYNFSDLDIMALKSATGGLELGSKRADLIEHILSELYIVSFTYSNVKTMTEYYDEIDQARYANAIKYKTKYVPVNRSERGFIADRTVDFYKIIIDGVVLKTIYERLYDNKDARDSMIYNIQLQKSILKRVKGTEPYPLSANSKPATDQSFFNYMTDINLNQFKKKFSKFFEIKSVLYNNNPLEVKIGRKEGLQIDDRYFVYNLVQRGNSISEKRVGVIRAAKRITDNRQIATGDIKPSSFYRVGGMKTLDKGMIVKAAPDKGISFYIGTGSSLQNYKPQIVLRASYNISKIINLTQLRLEMGLSLGSVNSSYISSLSEINLGIRRDYYFKTIFQISPYIGYHSGSLHSSQSEKSIYDFSGLGLGTDFALNIVHNVKLVSGFCFLNSRQYDIEDFKAKMVFNYSLRFDF